MGANTLKPLVFGPKIVWNKKKTKIYFIIKIYFITQKLTVEYHKQLNFPIEFQEIKKIFSAIKRVFLVAFYFLSWKILFLYGKKFLLAHGF